VTYDLSTSEYDLDSAKVNQHAKHLGQRSCRPRSKVTVCIRTHPNDCSIWTTEMGWQNYAFYWCTCYATTPMCLPTRRNLF